ncbi:alpha-2-macroglobulin family protein [Pedobacter sp. MW01-1-1]|uniref:alpha-2-macroglobulin family protein n=1 Tax=Pedobacter sp. MW01-1-1 TaxID=3383027 RepID=UPI003FEFA18A
MNLFLRFLALLICTFLLSLNVSAQQYTLDDFYRVDSIANRAQPKDALALIGKMSKYAHETHNTPLIIKTVIYRIMFQAYLEEDIFDKILIDLRKDISIAKQPEKSILQSLLAEMYWNYLKENNWQIRGRTQVQGQMNDNIKTWDTKKLNNEIVKYYLLSLQDVALLQQTKVDVLDAVLAGDKNNRNFRPTLYDLLAHRAIDVFSNTQINLTTYNDALMDWTNLALFGSRSDFLAVKLPVDSTSFTVQGIQVFKNLISFHQKSANLDALADADLRRLKFVSQYFMSDNQEAFGRALSRLAEQSTGSEVYADIVYEQAVIHKKAQMLIDTNKQNLITAVALAEKAISSYPNSVGAKNAKNLITQIKSSELVIQTKAHLQPDKSAQLHLTYKNVDTVVFRLFKSPDYPNQYKKFNSNKEFLDFLNNKQNLKEWIVVVPKTSDYQSHTLIDKLEGLPFNDYTLIAQAINRLKKDTVYSMISFKVTGMAVMNRVNIDKREYFVSQLNNGAPLKNVKIQQQRYDYRTGKVVNGDLITTNDEGYASTNEINNSMAWALVTLGKDALKLNINNYSYYSKEKDNNRVILFTDRPIYRPGQTIYYKGLCLLSNDGKNKIEVNKTLQVYFIDANGKEITTTSVTSNDYGTFQGTFSIPVGKLNGRMTIGTEGGNIGVQVEEYKRPTFEVVFDKPNQRYKLNDSIKVMGKASAFSGYAVGNAIVNYKIYRRALYDYSLYNTDKVAIYGSRPFERKQMAFGKTVTKAGGKFDITFFASATDIRQNYSYDVEVEVIDLNGETRSKTTSIHVGQKDISLNVSAEQAVYLSNKSDSLSFFVSNLNNESIKAKLKAEWSLLQAPSRLMNKSPFYAEKYAMTKEEFLEIFPHEDYNNELEVSKWPIKSVELKQNPMVKNGRGNLEFSQRDLKPGYYKIHLTAVNEQNDTIQVDKYLNVYHEKPAQIQSNTEWVRAEANVIKSGESAVFRLAGLSNDSKGYYEVYYRDSVTRKVWLNLSTKQSIIRIKPDENYENGFAVQFTMVHEGTVYNSMQQVSIFDPKKELNIKFLTFRNKLQPGEQESWKLQISNSDGEKQMAEMIATLYDASLDDLNKMNWNTYLQTSFNYYFYNWNFNVNTNTNPDYLWFLRSNFDYSVIRREYENINLFGYNYFGGYNSAYRNYLSNIRNNKKRGLQPAAIQKLAELEKGKLTYGVVFDDQGEPLPGVQIKFGKLVTSTNVFGLYTLDAKAGDKVSFSYIGYKNYTLFVGKKKRMDVTLKPDGMGLHDVTVVGYGSKEKKHVAAAASQMSVVSLEGKVAGIKIRGAATAVEDNQVYDYVSINSYNPQTGMEIVNGKPVIKKNYITPRTNFSELAFFYPQLLTDANGEIKIEFTIPQSLTRYKMMGFAHTKDLRTASITKELVTQKQLAIAINTPRFFREGDTIVLSAKLNNLVGKKLDGQASLTLTNALTGKSIQIFSKADKAEKTFEVDDKGSSVLKWTVVIPSGIHAITYKVLAQSGKFNDGEENTIPVLPNAMLVTESMPVNVRGNSTKTYHMEKLEKSGTSKTLRSQQLTFEFTSNPVWYAVQALPYLMEYPYACAEQTFSRFYANSFATAIINSSPKIKTVFEQWKNTNNGEALLSNLEKNQELKSVLLEETPWVRNADNETERKKRLALLFDLNRMTYELKNDYDKLSKIQYNNGAFPWFTGMKEDRYITQHIVLGMGQLKKMNLVDEKSYQGFNIMFNKAIAYLDAQLIRDYKREPKVNQNSYLPIHYLFARSYINLKNTSPDFIKARDFYLKRLITGWKNFDTYQLAQTALILNRNGHTAEAQKIITLLNQTAQHSEEMGMYWAKNKVGWWWYQSPVETQALLIEAFDEVAKDTKAVEEMKIWLLKNKQSNDWKTTKATAAACYALLMKGADLLSESNEPEITIGEQKLADLQESNPAKEAGTGYQKVSIAGANVKPEMGKVQIKNNNQTIAWGALYWQYFEQLDKITPANTGVKIKKQLFLQKASNTGNILTPLTPTNVLAPGDLVKVRVEIFCDRNMEYIHLKDMRSSGFEPVNVISMYKYQDGLGYYESTKDASTNFFISYMPRGTYVFEYPLRVTHSGNFSNGITTLQSMYAPEFTTHSAGIRVNVK